ncbi:MULTISPECIES: hypothetical protein [unclassified Streptomyces]|uniref:hypothetical protein n=1 Tax=unclassified Streptomyces TaxID=2593676 RepID=UPI000DD52397|nr:MULTISPECIES: hypothetical protein [unclassified Streptomyces]QZZ32107.1 hypothetical protein A7X85_43155 [Streptomyces sp. ST1015]
MPRYLKRTALALCAVASLAAAGTTTPHPPRTVLLDCAGHPQTRPTDYILACGDGNSRLTGLHWSRWTPAEAEGHGVNVVNDCVPYCAAGTFHGYPVRVRLDAPSAGQVRHYTRVTLTFTADRPDLAPRTVSYPLP